MPVGGCNAQPSNRAESDPLAYKPASEVAQPPNVANVESEPRATVAAVAAPAVVPIAPVAPPDFQPSANLNDIIKLARAGVSENLMLRFAGNTSGAFGLGAKEIIYLNDLGVSDAVINAMMQHDRTEPAAVQTTPAQQPVAEVVAPAAPVYEDQPEVVIAEPAPVTVNYFYETLSPYGAWVEVDGYGRCWQPTIVVQQPGWQPYRDRGHWVYSNHGWFWASDYSWGGVAFHYGRWFRSPVRGWVWIPDTMWSPAWVSWRQSNEYCGWAPLPPLACYSPGYGFSYRNRNVGISFDFGLGADCFTFVSRQNFRDPRWQHHAVSGPQAAQVFNNTTVYNNFNSGHNNSIVNAGVVTAAPANPKARPQIWTNINNGFSHRQPGNTLPRPPVTIPAQQPFAQTAPVAPATVHSQAIVVPERPHYQSPVVTTPAPVIYAPPSAPSAPQLRPGFTKPDNSAPRRPVYQPAPTDSPTVAPATTPAPTRPQKAIVPEQPHFQSPVILRSAPVAQPSAAPRQPDTRAAAQQAMTQVFAQPAPQPATPQSRSAYDPSRWTKKNSGGTN